MKQKKVINIVIIAIAGLICISALTMQRNNDFNLSKNLDIFVSLFRELNTFYVDDIDSDELIETGIKNMLATLDPYTVYYPESDTDELDLMTTGKYGGIGAMIRLDNEYCVISSVYQGFPADKANLRAGDILKKIDDFDLKNSSSEEVSNRLKGDPGTSLLLTVESNGEEKEVTLTRERVTVPPVPYYAMIDSEIGYISFTGFTENCIQDVQNALLDLKAQNATKIILDLRNNGGGLLSEAVEIVNLFVEAGNRVVSTKGKVRQFDSVYETTKEAIDSEIPLVVMINSNSASASEIVAGAIQDLDRGVIVGERSYGKGLVQVSRPLVYNTQLKVTTAKYYTPSGRCVQVIDYSHRDTDGSAGAIPDSLTSEFTTRNGRIVRDGGGISPDITIQSDTLGLLAAEIYLRNLAFDYATKYYWTHPTIAEPAHFSLSETEIPAFEQFLQERNFQYKTSTERSLERLISYAKQENYYSLYESTFNQLEQELDHNISQDLKMNWDDISEIIENEIVGRYYYDAGIIEWSLQDDPQIKEAIAILKDSNRYNSILTFANR